jgi:hypothetical protein
MTNTNRQFPWNKFPKATNISTANIRKDCPQEYIDQYTRGHKILTTDNEFFPEYFGRKSKPARKKQLNKKQRKNYEM